MNKLTADRCRDRIASLKRNRRVFGLAMDSELYLKALEIALPVLEQQEKVCQKCDGSGAMDSGTQMWGDTVYVDCDCVVEQQEKGDDGRNKMLSMPAMVTAQDMRETLNILLHEEEAEAAATGFNQCLMECAPIYEAYIRRSRCIDELVKELDGMQGSLNAKHRSFVAQRNRAEAAEAKLAELAPQPTNTPQIDNDGGQKCWHKQD